MVAFVTLFLGLVFGVQTVEVAVDGPVAAVELRLDGDAVAMRSVSPWVFRLDLGDEVRPHLLEAVALDGDGREIGRVEQWLNLPSREIESQIVISSGDNGAGVEARVLWESRVSPSPEDISVSFDGRPLAVSDSGRISLPPHNPDELHLLNVELRFPDDHSATIVKTIGGTYGDEVETELTAVPVLLPRGPLPRAEELMDSFVDPAGERLEVAAIERGLTDVVIVRDAEAGLFIDRLAEKITQVFEDPMQARFAVGLKKNHRLRFLSPLINTRQGQKLQHALFPVSQEYTRSQGGLPWLMHWDFRCFSPKAQRLAEAVAVAGLTAVENNRRRAVVLVLSDDEPDASALSAQAVRNYLAAIRVPLVVWGLADEAGGSAWQPDRMIRTVRQLKVAWDDLTKSLERQTIVWVRGRYLPQEIRVREGVELAMAR